MLRGHQAPPPYREVLDRQLAGILGASTAIRIRRRRRTGLIIALPLALAIGAGTLGVLQSEGFLGARSRVAKRVVLEPLGTPSDKPRTVRVSEAAYQETTPHPSSAGRHRPLGGTNKGRAARRSSHSSPEGRFADRRSSELTTQSTPSTRSAANGLGEKDAAPERKEGVAIKAARLDAKDALQTLRLH
ncbi:hypothetical protein [Sphingomonas sp.]|uniref:hypothetical protein n=1 Tax=Sphingomonas sp. TaxID=28214 RepID=UPI003B000EB4